MSNFGRMIPLAAILVLSLSSCTGRDHGPYRFENGDRIDRDGHREVHWCDDHREDDHCRR
jgi:hypothetical protein